MTVNSGRCAVCGRHYDLKMREYEDGRRPRVHYLEDGTRCPGCDLPAVPRRKLRRPRTNDNLGVVYKAIVDYIEREKIPPSVRDISDMVVLSTSAVFYNLKRLEEAGAIELRKGVSRGIIVKEEVEIE